MLAAIPPAWVARRPFVLFTPRLLAVNNWLLVGFKLPEAGAGVVPNGSVAGAVKGTGWSAAVESPYRALVKGCLWRLAIICFIHISCSVENGVDLPRVFKVYTSYDEDLADGALSRTAITKSDFQRQ